MTNKCKKGGYWNPQMLVCNGDYSKPCLHKDQTKCPDFAGLNVKVEKVEEVTVEKKEVFEQKSEKVEKKGARR